MSSRSYAADSASQDSIASCMDGVYVKIAENYKPPRKIAMPGFYNYKLPDVSTYNYDFQFENAVLEKVSEWRKVRSSITKRRKDLEEEKLKEAEKVKPPDIVTEPDDEKVTVKVAPPPETTILTPQPLSPLASQIQDIKINGLDYSDFDNDTSSPFDNMELKTINDMEELAQVLQPVSQWTAPSELKQSSMDIPEPTNDQEQPEELEKEDPVYEVVSEKEQSIKQENENDQQMVSSIVRDLQKLLERPYIENHETLNKQERSTSSEESPHHSIPETKITDPLLELSEEDQKLARHLNDMGFSLSRATRAIKTLGSQDNKNIVEYLLALQYLEDAGFDENTSAKALALTQFDEQKAKQYCDNLVI